MVQPGIVYAEHGAAVLGFEAYAHFAAVDGVFQRVVHQNGDRFFHAAFVSVIGDAGRDVRIQQFVLLERDAIEGQHAV